MTAKLIVIGLDAAEGSLIEKWATEGAMPHLASLMRTGATYAVGNPMETLPGAIWPELATGVSCKRTPHYYHPRQLHTGETTKRPIDGNDVNPETYFWTRASRGGARVAAIDMPQTLLAKNFNGVQLLEWGLHDRNFEIASDPPQLLETVRNRWGDHPVDVCDTHQRSPEGYRTLINGLKRGAAAKTELSLSVLESEAWDLFTCCFGETHCVGHQFWHFMDPSHPWHDPHAPAEFRNAVRDVYAAVDAGVGRLIAAAGPGAEVIVVASHGMGLYTGGPQLLPEALARLGLSSVESDKPAGKVLRKLQKSNHPVIAATRETVKRLLGKQTIKSLQTFSGSLHEPFESPRTRAADVPNNRCGAIRLNLKGREPLGAVAPGNEETDVTETIREALLELVHPQSGERVVDRILTAREAFGPDHHPDVPDMMIIFRDDLGVIDAARSDRLGLIEVPNFKPNLPRSGDHTVQSRFFIRSPRVTAGARLREGNVLDLTPTVLAMLGVPASADLDGEPLLRRTSVAAE